MFIPSINVHRAFSSTRNYADTFSIPLQLSPQPWERGVATNLRKLQLREVKLPVQYYRLSWCPSQSLNSGVSSSKTKVFTASFVHWRQHYFSYFLSCVCSEGRFMPHTVSSLSHPYSLIIYTYTLSHIPLLADCFSGLSFISPIIPKFHPCVEFVFICVPWHLKLKETVFSFEPLLSQGLFFYCSLALGYHCSCF